MRGENRKDSDELHGVGKEPVCDPAYWRERLARCGGELHRAIFNGSITQFDPFNQEHQRTLRNALQPNDKVLDVGCGYGRLLGLMPSRWQGEYLGVDISDEMLAVARLMYGSLHPRCQFEWMDLRCSIPNDHFDIAIVCSVRPMIIRHQSQAMWDMMERYIRAVSDRVLYLTYGEYD